MAAAPGGSGSGDPTTCVDISRPYDWRATSVRSTRVRFALIALAQFLVRALVRRTQEVPSEVPVRRHEMTQSSSSSPIH